MILHALGMDFRHDSDFMINRPDGSGDNLLIIFKSSAVIDTGNGIMAVPPDTAVIYSHAHPQIYGSDGTQYINHWLHFDCEGDLAFFERAHVPFDCLICPADISSAEAVMTQLSEESLSGGDPLCIDLLLRLLIARLGDSSGVYEQHTAHYQALRSLRAEIYRDPSKWGSVAVMAERMSMSSSHFQALYKKEFGTSCVEDVISARMETAKYYLKNTALSVKKIAELCGYENDVHFIRQFRQRVGMTSREYRRGVPAADS